MHMSLSTRLRDRERELGRPVRIGLAGAGQMGMGFVAQVKRIPGMETAAIADVLPGGPRRSPRPGSTASSRATTPTSSPRRSPTGGRSGCPTPGCWSTCRSTWWSTRPGCRTSAPSVLQRPAGGKDVASLNAEADVTIGLLLSRVARSSGQVYALCKGDEPVEVKELFDYVTDIGFEVTCAGKGKNNPLQPHATPTRWPTRPRPST